MARTKNALSQDPDAVLERKLTFAAHLESGLTVPQAGRNVGLKEHKSMYEYRDDPIVIAELTRLREENRKALTMTREKVQALVMEAVEMSRVMSDPMAMIRAAQEINKMCGFYAPEEKKIILSTSQKRLVQKYDNMSDEELAIAAEKDEAIEGEFTEVEEPKILGR